MEDYKKYRWFFTSSGTLIIGGKNAIQNDELLFKIKEKKESYIIMHTSEPGSPFSIIYSPASKVSKIDVEEAAIFTGCFSQAWKKGKLATKVDIFNSDQIHKNSDMKQGTWGVYGQVQKINVSLNLVFTKQKGILRAIPEKTFERTSNKEKSKEINMIKISPGNTEKDHMFAKLELELDIPLSEQEVLSAIPSGKFKISKEVVHTN